jgi:hypothetical protein
MARWEVKDGKVTLFTEDDEHRIHLTQRSFTMNITISFDVDGFTNSDELIAWLNVGLTGEPVKRKRNRKPMTEEEKAAFRARMVKGQEDAAIAREKKEPVASPKPSLKKSDPERRKVEKKKASK